MPSLDDSLGALVVGSTISIFLFGISTVQLFIYWKYFRADKASLKALATFIWFFELGHAICTFITIYTMTVTLFGNPNILLGTYKVFGVGVIFSSTIALVTQLFFNYRAWKATNKTLIALFLLVLSILRFIGNFSVAIEAFSMNTETFVAKFDWLMTTVWIVGAVVDVLTTLLLCYVLNQRRQAAMRSTVHLLDKLILWAIETGLVTSVTAVTMAICFLTMKNNLIWLGMYMFLPRLFANCLYAALNARNSLRSTDRNDDGVVCLSSFSPISFGFRPRDSELTFSHDTQDKSSGNIAIEMMTQAVVDVNPDFQVNV